MSSIQEQATVEYGAIRIVSLPHGYDTYAGAKYFVEEVLQLGIISDLKVKNINMPNGSCYTTANVEFVYWFNNELSVRVQKELIEVADRCEDVENTSIHIASSDITGRAGQFAQFVFSNGKPMTHISIRNVKTTPRTDLIRASLDGAEPLFYADQAPEMWSSIYIPNIVSAIHYDGKHLGDSSNIPLLEANLKEIFEEKLCVGRIGRVDFVDAPILNSTGDTIRSNLKAFVHFNWWANTPTAIQLRQTLEQEGQFRMIGVPNKRGGIDGFSGITSQLHPFLLLKVNHKPIPAAVGTLNVHQLTAILEEKTKQMDLLLSITADLLNRLTEEGCVSCDEAELLGSKLKEIGDSNSKGK